MHKSTEWKHISFPFKNMYFTYYLRFLYMYTICFDHTHSLFLIPPLLESSPNPPLNLFLIFFPLNLSPVSAAHMCIGVGHSPPTSVHNLKPNALSLPQ